MVDTYTQLLRKTGKDLLNDYNLAKNNPFGNGALIAHEGPNPTVFVYFDGKLRVLYSEILGINRKLSNVLKNDDVDEKVNFVVYTKNHGSFFRCPVEANDKLNKKGQRVYLEELTRDGLISPDIISGYSGAVVEDPVLAVPSASNGEKAGSTDTGLDNVSKDKTEQTERDVFLGISCMMCPEKYTHNVLAIGHGGAYIAPKNEEVDYSEIMRDVFGPGHYLVKPLVDNDTVNTVAGKHMNNNFNEMVAEYNKKIPIIFNSH